MSDIVLKPFSPQYHQSMNDFREQIAVLYPAGIVGDHLKMLRSWVHVCKPGRAGFDPGDPGAACSRLRPTGLAGGGAHHQNEHDPYTHGNPQGNPQGGPQASPRGRPQGTAPSPGIERPPLLHRTTPRSSASPDGPPGSTAAWFPLGITPSTIRSCLGMRRARSRLWVTIRMVIPRSLFISKKSR